MLHKLNNKLADNFESLQDENMGKTIELINIQSKLGEIEHQNLSIRLDRIEQTKDTSREDSSRQPTKTSEIDRLFTEDGCEDSEVSKKISNQRENLLQKEKCLQRLFDPFYQQIVWTRFQKVLSASIE